MPGAYAQSSADLDAARAACLQEKVAAAQAQKKKKKKGFGKLIGAVANTAVRYGGTDLSRDMAEISADVYDANATAADLEDAAEALGISKDDLEDCQDPAGAGY